MTMRHDYSLGPYHGGEHFPLLSHIVNDLHPAGHALEFGVGQGASLRLIAARMPTVGFDSFAGLPDEWRPGYPKGAFATTPPAVVNTRLVIGQFADTLPRFDFTTVEPIGLIHFDADLYSSTLFVLVNLLPRLRKGDLLIFDEFVGCFHEFRAFLDATTAFPVEFEAVGHDADWIRVALKVV